MEIRFAGDVPGVWPTPKIQSDVAGPGKPKKSEVRGVGRRIAQLLRRSVRILEYCAFCYLILSSVFNAAGTAAQ